MPEVLSPKHTGIKLRHPRTPCHSILLLMFALAAAAGICTEVLPRILQDVDVSEKIKVQTSLHPKREPFRSQLISVVIPTLNEVFVLRPCVEAAVRGAAHAIEIIVSDGGSTDGTLDLVAALQQEWWWPSRVLVHTIEGGVGRGAQLRHGIAAASGDMILMVHADTKLPPNYDKLILDVLATPGVVAGAFAFDLDVLQPGADCPGGQFFRWQMRLLRWGTNLRARLFELPYGDQAIFVNRLTLNQAGGVPEVPLLEDVQLMKRLWKFGHVKVLDLASGAVVTSARRWLDNGFLMTTGFNQLVLLAYNMGVPPEKLAEWYYRRPKNRRHNKD